MIEEKIKKIMSVDYTEIPGLSEELAKEMQESAYTFSALLQGKYGTGKTRMLGTLPLPLLIYAFDPKCAVVLMVLYRELIEKGWIVVLPLWGEEKLKKPINFKNFVSMFDAHVESGFFNKFASVAVDSFSTFSIAGANYILHDQNEKRRRKWRGPGFEANTNLTQPDYNPLYTHFFYVIHTLQGSTANFVMTGHLEPEKEPYKMQGDTNVYYRTTGYSLRAYHRLKEDIPRLFSEKYIMLREGEGKDQEFSLLTAPKDLYYASSQLAANGALDYIEKPNFRHLLKKANYPYRDKPHWQTDEELDLALLPDFVREHVE